MLEILKNYSMKIAKKKPDAASSKYERICNMLDSLQILFVWGDFQERICNMLDSLQILFVWGDFQNF
jgi:hypothetical protein